MVFQKEALDLGELNHQRSWNPPNRKENNNVDDETMWVEDESEEEFGDEPVDEKEEEEANDDQWVEYSEQNQAMPEEKVCVRCDNAKPGSEEVIKRDHADTLIMDFFKFMDEESMCFQSHLAWFQLNSFINNS